MFGDSILFVPKLEEPVDGINEILVNLPAGTWYNYNTGTSVTGPSFLYMNLNAQEIGLFFKGGSILPMLDHQRELSLMQAIDNPMALEVRVDEKGEAAGKLTLDDGITTMDTRSDVAFTFKQNVLSFEVTRLPVVPVALKSSHVSIVVFYGIKFSPNSIFNMITGKTISHSEIVYDSVHEKLIVENLDVDVVKSSLDVSVEFLILKYLDVQPV